MLTLVVCVLVFYALLFIFDALLRSFQFYPYFLFLQKLGIEFKILQIKWNSTALNRVFTRMGTWRYVYQYLYSTNQCIMLICVFQTKFSSALVFHWSLSFCIFNPSRNDLPA